MYKMAAPDAKAGARKKKKEGTSPRKASSYSRHLLPVENEARPQYSPSSSSKPIPDLTGQVFTEEGSNRVLRERERHFSFDTILYYLTLIAAVQCHFRRCRSLFSKISSLFVFDRVPHHKHTRWHPHTLSQESHRPMERTDKSHGLWAGLSTL